MNVPALVVGFAKSPGTPALGLASIALGIAEVNNSMLLAFAGLVGGGGLLILAWFANAVEKVMERWLEAQGQKLIDLPTAAQLTKDKEGLTAALTAFTESAELERREMGKFRETLAATLADHGARITGLERRARNTGEIFDRGKT